MSPLLAGLLGLSAGLIAAGVAWRRAAAVRVSRDHHRAVLERLEDAVIAVDGRRQITVLNAAARRMLAPGREVQPGQTLSAVVSQPELRGLLLSAPGAPSALELTLESGRIVRAQASPRDAKGGSLLVIHDITELRRLETLRRDFVANVSHELRTPVSVIQANAETLLDGALDEPEVALRFTRAILRNAERLSRLVSDLLDLSRIEVGRYDLDIRPSRVAPCARRALDTLGQRAEDSAITVAIEIPDALQVLADTRALDQILVNLVDNAVKYSAEGGAVVIRAGPAAGGVLIQVEDDGIGVPPESRDRLFERFYRVDPGRSRQAGGTGLGLAIVKHLAASMRGRVGMSPAAPVGSVFWVELPAADEARR